MSTKIEWCEETWNPIIGCTKVSPGCDNCYAEKMAYRLAAMGIKNAVPEGIGRYVRVIKGRKWDGTTDFDNVAILKPLSWRKPKTIFVCSMGDLFHAEVPFAWVDKVMAIAALSPRHTFILLTKRPARMKDYFNKKKNKLVQAWEDASYDMGLSDNHEDVDAPPCYIFNRAESEWPLKNVWIGVTAENQEQAEKRIPILYTIPAVKRFISVEPMLSHIDLALNYDIDWVICGGESGPRARPMHPDWVRSLRDQCQAADTPFFFKQWGEWYPDKKGIYRNSQSMIFGDTVVHRVGKKAAGSTIDGKQFKEYPE
jgi:protein gp37